MKYSQHYSSRKTSQSQPIPGKAQVKNRAGGYTYKLDKWGRLDRFLILGSEGGTYYVQEQPLTVENADNILACLKADGKRTVDVIVDISKQGRAPRNTPAEFALALAASHGDEETRKYALSKVSEVCRIGTHLFHFLREVQEHRGWGRSLKRAVAEWYNGKSPDKLFYQLIKYQQRDGFSHRDALRLAHPVPATVQHKLLYRMVTQGYDKIDQELLQAAALGDELLGRLESVQGLAHATPAEAAALIRNSNLPREVVPTELLQSAEVWEALLQDMPVTAMIRNLGNLSKHGVVTPFSDGAKYVVQRLQDEELLQRGRVHPMQVLFALKTYGAGQGFRGRGEWPVVPQVLDALDDAFYATFKMVPSTGQRYLLGIDVSGSMSSPIMNSNLSAAEGAAAMAMTIVRSEPQTFARGFSGGYSWYRRYEKQGTDAYGFRDLGITSKQTLGAVLKQTRDNNFGATDCAIPMLWAQKTKTPVDVFVVLTDNETWAGDIHPTQALEQYRQEMGIDAKLVVVGMTATEITIADPDDAGMLDVVGFDAAAPAVISEFSRAR